jgi:hypothetical protein
MTPGQRNLQSPIAHLQSRIPWPTLLGVVLSIALLWWTLHDVSLREVWGHIRQVRLAPFAATIVLATLTFPLRTVRWRYLLRLEGAPLPFVPLWHATAIGFMANNLLPARAGEVARAYAARKLTAVPFTQALASLVVERVLDGIGIVALLTVAIWAGGFDATTTVAGIRLVSIVRSAAIVFVAALAAAAIFVHWPGPALRLADAGLRRLLPARWGDKIFAALEGVVSGLDVLRSPARLLRVGFWTLVVWLVNAASFWTCLIAFEIDIPASAALLVQGLIAFGVAVPATPGFWGPWEAACRVSLALYGVEASRAVSYAVGYHLFTFIPITVLGLFSLSRAHLHLAELKDSKE